MPQPYWNFWKKEKEKTLTGGPTCHPFLQWRHGKHWRHCRRVAVPFLALLLAPGPPMEAKEDPLDVLSSSPTFSPLAETLTLAAAMPVF